MRRLQQETDAYVAAGYKSLSKEWKAKICAAQRFASTRGGEQCCTKPMKMCDICNGDGEFDGEAIGGFECFKDGEQIDARTKMDCYNAGGESRDVSCGHLIKYHLYPDSDDQCKSSQFELGYRCCGRPKKCPFCTKSDKIDRSVVAYSHGCSDKVSRTRPECAFRTGRDSMEADRFLDVTVADVSDDVERVLWNSAEMPPCSSLKKEAKCKNRFDCKIDSDSQSCVSTVINVDATCSEARSKAFANLPNPCTPESSSPQVCDICKVSGGVFDPTRPSGYGDLSCGDIQAAILFTDDCPSRQRAYGKACCNDDPIVCDIVQTGELIPNAIAFMDTCVDSGGSQINVKSWKECYLAKGTPVSFKTCQNWQLEVNKDIMSTTGSDMKRAKRCSRKIHETQLGGATCSATKLEKCQICLKGMTFKPDNPSGIGDNKCSDILPDISYLRGEHCEEEGKKFMSACCT